MAARGRATLVVLDTDGTIIAAPTDELATMMARMHGLAAVDAPRGDPVSEAVVVDGQTVGAVMLRFPTTTMDAERHVATPSPEQQSQGPRRIRRGVDRCRLRLRPRHQTRHHPHRGRTACCRPPRHRVDLTDAPGELRSLADAFNEMADHLDRADQLRRNLLADVAHELRTPLTILQGNTEALLDGIDEPTPAAIASLHDEVVRLRRLVADLETLAAAEAAGLRLDAVPVDLADIAHATVELSARSSKNATSPSTSTVARRRPTATRTGCSKSSSTSSPTHSSSHRPAETSPSPPQSPMAGNPHHHRHRPRPTRRRAPIIFERFWRSHSAGRTQGSGIGLAVVAELVAAHHGTINATNRANGGAEFTITMPADEKRLTMAPRIDSLAGDFVAILKLVPGDDRVECRRCAPRPSCSSFSISEVLSNGQPTVPVVTCGPPRPTVTENCWTPRHAVRPTMICSSDQGGLVVRATRHTWG